MKFTSVDYIEQSVPVLNEENFLSILETIGVDEAQEKYQLSNFIYATVGENDYTDTSGQTWCVYRGDLHLASLETGRVSEISLYSLIVDGNLIVDDDIDWCEGAGQSLLMVTGSVKCRNLFMDGGLQMVVRGGLSADNAILGQHGDDFQGKLTVDGDTKAKIVYCTTSFIMHIKVGQETKVICDSGEVDSKVDYDEAKAIVSVLPEYINDGKLNVEKLKKAFIIRKPILSEFDMSNN